MDPDKQTEPAAVTLATAGSTSTDDPAGTMTAESVMIERDAVNLLQELGRLMRSRNALDENRAKQLRRSWETLNQALPADSPSRDKLEQQFESLRKRIHQQVETRNHEFSELEDQIEHLRQTVKAGDLKSSQLLEQSVITALNRIRGLSAQRRQKIIGELEALQPKIKKLASWRHWGTEQAREKIIAEIQQIHESENDLAKVAKRIQAAREEWKTWDQSGEGGDHRLYPLFDAACSKAYEPCKAHFDAQRKQRQAASKHRSQVCETLEKAYEETDWRDPDWKAVQQLVREQSGRWRKLGPAEYRDRKPLGKRFDAILYRFEGPLDRERKRNLKQRRDLIAQVEQLSQQEDTRKAISELQQLKKGWQVTVSGRRKQEQQLWKQFTTACDAIYNRGREAKKAFEQQLVEHLDEKRRLCAEIEAALDNIPGDISEFESLLKHWKVSWENTGRAPKNQSRPIENRYRELMKRMHGKLSALHRAAERAADKHLIGKATICADLEKRLLEGGALDVESARESFDRLPGLPGDAGSAMAARFATIESAAREPGKLDAIRQSLPDRFQCINEYLLQLEINAGVESPAEFSKQRMALQIGRLSAAIGKGTDRELLDTRTLIRKIHTTGAVSPAQQVEIDRRFKTCYEALQSSDRTD